MNDGGFEASRARKALSHEIMQVFKVDEYRAHLVLLTLLTGALQRQLPLKVRDGQYQVGTWALKDALPVLQASVPHYAQLPEAELYDAGLRLQGELWLYWRLCCLDHLDT